MFFITKANESTYNFAVYQMFIPFHKCNLELLWWCLWFTQTRSENIFKFHTLHTYSRSYKKL